MKFIRLAVLAALIIVGFVVGLTAGCQSPPQRIAYNVAAVPAVTLDQVMKAWGDYVHQYHPGVDVERKVLAAYQKARTAELVDIDAAHAYANSVGTTNVIGAIQSPEAGRALAELIDLLKSLGVKI